MKVANKSSDNANSFNGGPILSIANSFNDPFESTSLTEFVDQAHNESGFAVSASGDGVKHFAIGKTVD